MAGEIFKVIAFEYREAILPEVSYKPKKPPSNKWWRFLKVASTYSPTLKRAVPSAQVGLTSLFGMGRGGPYCYKHLKLLMLILIIYQNLTSNNLKVNEYRYDWSNKVYELESISLRVISTTQLWHYCLYTCSLSTW